MTDKKCPDFTQPMGLPRAGAAKRRWTDEEETNEPPTKALKVLCTSPPHALRAEDVAAPAVAPHSTTEESKVPSKEIEVNETKTETVNEDDIEDEEDEEMEGEAGGFMDDDEDKDSGFIDGNSIDNSSDDEADSSAPKEETDVSHETNLQMSLAKVLSPSTSTSPSEDSVTLSRVDLPITTVTNAVILPPPTLTGFIDGNLIADSSDDKANASTLKEISTSQETNLQLSLAKVLAPSESTNLSPLSSLEKSVAPLKSETLLTTTTVTTITNNALTFSPATFTATYSASGPTVTFVTTFDASSAFPTPTWSCTFYDGSQPTTTNKYMEISPPRVSTPAPGSLVAPPAATPSPPSTPPPPSQSIQCDENGKSYLELGAASPYTLGHGYTNNSDCPPFSVTPPTPSFHGSAYNANQQNFSGGTYFNNRTGFTHSGPPYGYPPNGEGYTNYDGEGCVYPFHGGRGFGHGIPRGVGGRGGGRCDSPRGPGRPTCYELQRMSVWNTSVAKLARMTRVQAQEPSLLRQALVLSTLRMIEREMEAEGVSMTPVMAPSHGASAALPETMPSSSSDEGPLPSLHSPLMGPPLLHPPLPPSTPPPSSPIYNIDPPSAAYSAPFVTPSPLAEDESRADPIPWCSVLSLPSQSDLDSINNNDCQEWTSPAPSEAIPSVTIPTPVATRAVASSSSSSSLQVASGSPGPPVTTSSGSSSYTVALTEDSGVPPSWKLPSLSADDVLKSFPEVSRRSDDDLETIMRVLVGSSS